MNLAKKGRKRKKQDSLSFFANNSRIMKRASLPDNSALDKPQGDVIRSTRWTWPPGLKDYVDFVDDIMPLDLEIEFDPFFTFCDIISTDLDVECLDSATIDDQRVYWTNEQGQFSSPKKNHPSVFYLDEDLVCYHKAGLLHRTDGPAVKGKDREDSYWLFGVQVSKEEHSRFNELERTIVFTDHEGYLHRDDGPALIKFDPDGKVTKKWFTHGICDRIVNSTREAMNRTSQLSETTVSRTIKPKKISTPKVKVLKMDKVPSIPIVALSQEEADAIVAFFSESKNKEILNNYRHTIRATAEAITRLQLGNEKYEQLVKEEAKKLKEEKKAVMTETKIIRSAPDTSGTRSEQFLEGFKFGLKKGAINNGSEILAKSIVSRTSHEGNEWIERAAQFAILLGLAEAIKRMPDSIAEKMRLDEQTRLNAVSMLRYIGGENIGGDIVDIVAAVLPTLLEIVKDLSTEDINQLAEQMEQAQEQEVSSEAKRLLEL